jgi:hypothetical protein
VKNENLILERGLPSFCLIVLTDDVDISLLKTRFTSLTISSDELKPTFLSVLFF